jgi:hypothetical protein
MAVIAAALVVMVAAVAVKAAAMRESRCRNGHKSENGKNDPHDFDPSKDEQPSSGALAQGHATRSSAFRSFFVRRVDCPARSTDSELIAPLWKHEVPVRTPCTRLINCDLAARCQKLALSCHKPT